MQTRPFTARKSAQTKPAYADPMHAMCCGARNMPVVISAQLAEVLSLPLSTLCRSCAT